MSRSFNHSPKIARSRRRRGYTLVDMVVSISSATVLMMGLASLVHLSSRGFEQVSSVRSRSRTAVTHSDLLADLRFATSFKAATNQAVTFTVPDRDGNGGEEKLAYWWTGLPDAKLMHSVNDGPAVPLLDDVQQCQFTYLTRTLALNPYTPPALQPDQWGMRWAVAGRFGYDAIFPTVTGWRNYTIATRTTLDKPGTLKSITAYLDSPGGNYRFALYSHNTLFGPTTLIAQSGVASGGGTGWHTLTVPATPLLPGTYWLTMYYTGSQQKHYYVNTGGETRRSNYDSSGGFPALWSGASSTFAYRLSIYGTYDQ